MPTTEHIHLPLYGDEEAPDISTSGHYNHAMEILDANVGELETGLAEETKQRKAADAELEGKVEEEATARADADKAINDTLATKADSADVTALGKRVDNAEVEISANSADLTGIKGLTYGTGQQVFLEEENGEYSSPALEEIQHEIEDSKVTIIAPTRAQDTPPTAHSISAVAIGNIAKAGLGGVAIGSTASATDADSKYAKYCTAVGESSKANCGGVALGRRANATYTTADVGPIAIGYNTSASGQACVVIGSNSSNGRTFSNCTILGPNVKNANNDTIVISAGVAALTVPDSRSHIAYFNTDNAATTLANVADPTKAQDAATKNYVDTAIAGVSGGGSGLTVINVGDKTSADLYAEVQAAWPNCLLTTQSSGSPYYYPISSTSSSYRFAGQVTNKGFVLIAVRASAIQDTLVEFTTGNTTWGDLEQQVAV